jgi:hypothetical protein
VVRNNKRTALPLQKKSPKILERKKRKNRSGAHEIMRNGEIAKPHELGGLPLDCGGVLWWDVVMWREALWQIGHRGWHE